MKDKDGKDNKLEDILGRGKSTEDKHQPLILNSSEDLDSIAIKKSGFSLTKNHLKGLGILGGSLALAYLFRENFPEWIEYFRTKLPWISDEQVSLTIDVVTNSIIAPIGFIMSSYTNGKKIDRKELAGQFAFAATWGTVRHYFYGFLSTYDMPVTADNIAKKTAWFLPYTLFYANFYMAYSNILSEITEKGANLSEAIRKLKGKFAQKSRELLQDGQIWTNMALLLTNLYLNPIVESRPTIAAMLLIDYNLNVIKHSHERNQGLWDYAKGIFRKDA